MGRLFYKPENAWVGDLIPYYENGTYSEVCMQQNLWG